MELGTSTWAVFQVAHVGLLVDGRMGASRARSERIRTALEWARGK